MRLLLFATFAATLAASTSAVECTTEQLNSYNSIQKSVASDCQPLLDNFDVCNDECLASFKTVAQAAPNCTSRMGLTEYRVASTTLSLCEKAHANTTNKYIPQASPSAPTCDSTVLHKWSKLSDAGVYQICKQTISKRNKCDDDCLKTIEEGITQAPACRQNADTQYLIAESNKYVLAKCLNARGADLASNQVLQTLPTPSASSAAGVIPKTAAFVTLTVAVLAAAL